jgi:hypothetical protein
MITPITNIRNYFNTQILALDPDLLPWTEDVFGNNDESKPQAEKYYNLVIGINTPIREDNNYWDEIDVTLDLYTLMTTDYQLSFDTAYDLAINVKNELINPISYGSLSVLNDIVVNEITPIEDANNDNAMKISLNFTVRINYNFC